MSGPLESHPTVGRMVALGGQSQRPALLDASLLNLVAHEMRAPLAVFKGYLAMLRDEQLDEALRAGAVSAMEAKAEELEELAEILIAAARLESRDPPHDPTVFDVAEAVSLAVERLAPRAWLEQAELVVVPTPRPAWVRADRSQVTRILTNLLNNGLTYCNPPAEVGIEVRTTSPVEVAVHDRGLGIAPEHQGRIFERFSRFAEAGGGRHSGLGLGLSISRHLAELNEGRLILETSALGEGSIFVLQLPAAENR
jgi:two-component system, OmpR family, phosphate regulon sensor histidine kinase PhoR